MDLLAGYGSGSESEHEDNVGSLGRSGKEEHIQEEKKTLASSGGSLADLPPPSSSSFNAVPLFNGHLKNSISSLKMKKKKKLVARFSVPIDYGDAPDHLDDADTDTLTKQRIKISKQKLAAKSSNTASGMLNISSFLPPPVNTAKDIDDDDGDTGDGIPHNTTKTNTYNNDDDDDDDDIIPGTEDRTGMFFGKHPPPSISTETLQDQSDIPHRAHPSSESLHQQYIPGEYQGQQYLYDPSTGQYYYPETQLNGAETTVPTVPRPPIATATACADTFEYELLNDRATSSTAAIQFKEVSGAALRYMDPSQRAEYDALRSALGSDYEDRLKQEASKVGSISKTAKRKHQLSSLYVHSKDQELEQLEKGAKGSKTKAETQKKYAW